MSARTARRRLAPEVIQTSTMDCGPAALKCLAEGHGVRVSYGRLREACQTDVDGSSIDALETVARQLGLDSEQVLIPADHLALPEAGALPAIVVVRHAQAARHFVVVWSRIGPWLQVMDPGIGRRWLRADRFHDEAYRHEASVPAAEWRAWAGTDAFLAPLRAQMTSLDVADAVRRRLLDAALADPRWFGLAVLDAGVRLTAALAAAGGVRRGAEAAKVLEALASATAASPDDIYARIPEAYWTATPDPANRPGRPQSIVVRGAVLLSVRGRTGEPVDLAALSPEVAAAVAEAPERPLLAAARLLRDEGLAAPVTLGIAAAVAVGGLVLETLLFRGLFEIGARLALPAQRWAAGGALVIFLLGLLTLHLPIAVEATRLGRRLEMRLRIALLAKLPRLHDRYFQSRAVTDMADRSHALHLTRAAPTLALQLLQAVLELSLTAAALIVLAPEATAATLLVAVVAAGLPALIQPFLNERDLRVRTHGAALGGFYLDALVGLAPIRAHRAEASVRRQHEHLLVEWARAFGAMLRFALAAQAVQATICGLAVGLLLIAHFTRTGGVQGGDLLLVYWALKLPALGAQINALARQLPGQRNTLSRLMEPLNAPEGDTPAPAPARAADGALSLVIRGGRVLAGGQEILVGLNLEVAPSEHVAIVGPSGAGKSSLFGILLGWNRLAEGDLRVDGRTLEPGGMETLRRGTAWVDPAVQIWNRSLGENLAYAADEDDPARMADVMEAARLQSVLERLPRGLRSELGEGGRRLSGGEGQRVRLGRALMADAPRLVLLDEPFRGLDRDQRRTLLAEAREWWGDATLLCITHDIEETLAFSRVLVIDEGRIVEDGAPGALATGASRYAALLGAERELREAAWGDGRWRRLRLEGGILSETEKAA